MHDLGTYFSRDIDEVLIFHNLKVHRAILEEVWCARLIFLVPQFFLALSRAG
jgi:hypothetical protein